MSKKRIKPKYKSKYVLTESGCEVLGIPFESNKRATLSNILQMKNILQLEGETPMIEKNPHMLKALEQQLIGIVAHLAKTYGQEQTKKFITDMVNDDCFWNALNEAIEVAVPEKPRIITP